MGLTKEKLQGIVRHTLTFVGGILVMKGLLDETLFNELLGSVVTLAGTVWSIITKAKGDE